MLPPVELDLPSPSPCLLMLKDTSILRLSLVPLSCDVLPVTGRRDDSEILSAAIELVAIDVVYLDPISGPKAKNCSVQIHADLTTIPRCASVGISGRVE